MEEMKRRAPLIHWEFVGRLERSRQLQQLENTPFKDDMSLVNRILYNIDRGRELDEQERMMRMTWEAREPEEEEEEVVDSTIVLSIKGTNAPYTTAAGAQDCGGIARVDEKEPEEKKVEEGTIMQDASRTEFIRIMHERFISGLDFSFFDYETVDEDESLDEIGDRELEDKWFDTDDDQGFIESQPETVYTGILDY